jgi:hypothetical protein
MGFSASLATAASARKIDKYLTHYFGGNGKKLRTVPPMLLLGVDQSDVGFMNQCGRLQDVVRLFQVHVTPGNPMKLRINGRDQLI